MIHPIIFGDFSAEVRTSHQTPGMNPWHKKCIDTNTHCLAIFAPTQLFEGKLIFHWGKSIQRWWFMYTTILETPEASLKTLGSHDSDQKTPWTNHWLNQRDLLCSSISMFLLFCLPSKNTVVSNDFQCHQVSIRHSLQGGTYTIWLVGLWNL